MLRKRDEKFKAEIRQIKNKIKAENFRKEMQKTEDIRQAINKLYNKDQLFYDIDQEEYEYLIDQYADQEYDSEEEFQFLCEQQQQQFEQDYQNHMMEIESQMSSQDD